MCFKFMGAETAKLIGLKVEKESKRYIERAGRAVNGVARFMPLVECTTSN